MLATWSGSIQRGRGALRSAYGYTQTFLGVGQHFRFDPKIGHLANVEVGNHRNAFRHPAALA